MRKVNIKELAYKCHSNYLLIEQPMYVYHSNREFREKETVGISITSLEEYLEFFRDNAIDATYRGKENCIDMRPYNLWIKTVDEYIPDTCLVDGTIIYMLDAEGQKIRTDGVWVRLFFINVNPVRHILFTSSGITSVSLMKWDLTGAVKVSFLSERDLRKGKDAYERELARYLKRKRPNIPLLRIAMAVISPSSETFLNIHKSVRTVFKPGAVRDADVNKIITSYAFKEALMSVIKTLYPTLGPAIRALHSPEEMARKLAVVWDIAKDSKKVEDMLRVINKIEESGYAESTVTAFGNALPLSQQQVVQPLPEKLVDGKELQELRDENGISSEMIYDDSEIPSDEAGL